MKQLCWIYFLKFKTQVPEVSSKFKPLVENQSGCRIQIFRSGNGTEYTSDRFEKFCENIVIEHQLTIPYIPHRNGVTERKNISTMEMLRGLLYEKVLCRSS